MTAATPIATTSPLPLSHLSGSGRFSTSLQLELAKCLQLVVPASMTADDRAAWLMAAVDALEDIRADEVQAVSAEVRRRVTRPAQIVPEIARLVAERRSRRPRNALPAPAAVEKPPRPPAPPLTAAEISRLSPTMLKMGLKCGAIAQAEDGSFVDSEAP